MKLSSFIASIFVLLCTASAFAYESGDIIMRVGAAHVDPEADSSNLYGPAAPLVAPNPNGVDAGKDTQMGITFTYMVNENVGVELLAATPFGHSIHGTGTLNDLKIASTKQLPPTVNVQFYPSAGDATVKPYFGIGMNYTKFFDTEASATLEAVGNSLGVVVNEVVLSSSKGVSLQAGADIDLGGDWFANVALWKLDIDTNADVVINGQRLVEVDVDIDPEVYMIGVGKKF